MKSPITTHILDTARGCPASGVEAILYGEDLAGHDAGELGRGTTDADGRIGDLLPPGHVLEPGIYRLHFVIAPYFEALETATFYPAIDLRFRVDDAGEHYHVPLLLSPFGYSTYRGS